MADGQVALPARDGFGTIAIYKDGRVDLGVWGADIQASPDMQVWAGQRSADGNLKGTSTRIRPTSTRSPGVTMSSAAALLPSGPASA